MSRLLSHFYVGLLSLAGSVALAEEPKPLHVDIAAQPVGDALNQFAEQSGLQVVLYADDAKGIDVAGVSGQFDDATVALDSLLASTGLEYAFINDRTVAVASAQKVAEEGGDSDSGNGRTAGATLRPAMMAQAPVEQSQTSRRTETDNDRDDKKRPLEEIIVTGTNIRGIAPESSPVRIFDREDIQISGAGTAQDFINLLPENFGGGAAEFGNAPGNDQAGGNNSRGSSVNLRGLGSGSTLVLMNGRRIAPSSTIGGFVDISMIPASAIERVEVLTDGASSIYGGDAVGGVVNFVLRDDFDGVETSLRYGTVTDGDLEEYRAAITGGENWSSGNGLLVYEYHKRDNLDSSDRAFSEDFLSPNDLLPKQQRHSVIGSWTQQMTHNLEFGADILYSQRESSKTRTLLTGVDTGTMIQSKANSQNLSIGADLNWHVAGDWHFDIAGAYSEVDENFFSLRARSSDFIRQDQDNESTLWSIEGKGSGTVLDLPGGSAKLAIGGHFRRETFRDTDRGIIRHEADRKVYAAFGEMLFPIIGPDNALSWARRLEVNVSGRYEDYSDFGAKATPKVGLLWAPIDSLKLRASYGTSFKPPTVGQTGALDRGATAAPTSTVFSIFGATPADPSIADVVVLYTFGTSANLDVETSRAFTGGFDFAAASGRHTVSLSSTYFDIEFEDRISETPVPGNVNDLLAFNVAFDSPELFPEGTFIFSPTSEELNEVLESLIIPPDQLFGADPLDTAIISSVNVDRNLSRTVVRGVDFKALYSFDTGIGFLTLGINGAYLFDFTQQASVTTPVVQLLDTQFNPLSFNFRSRVGYARDGFNANLFVNYADDYNIDNTDAGMRISSWTTVDASISYDTREDFGSPILSNTVFRLSIQNLLDKDPPEALSFPGIGFLGYDPTNASPLGRFIAFELTKQF